MEHQITKEEAKVIIRSAVDSMSDEERGNLAFNLSAGATLLCGRKAFMFSDHNSGDMITLSITRELPDHPLDFVRIRKLNELSSIKYNELIHKYTMNYYHATQLLDEKAFKSVLMEHLCLEL